MKTYHFKNVFNEREWIGPSSIEVDKNKVIEKISPLKKLTGKEKGHLIPGFQNAHSHAFQYAMAGMNEGLSKASSSDDFWSWRENMYGLALSLGPEEMESIATELYKKMISHGHISVAEFHYLHHDKNGFAYNNLSEMSEALMRASEKAGIELTLIPIFYQRGGFGKEASARQRRFLSKSPDEYLKLVDSVKKSSKSFDNVKVGIGVHSLRAVEEDFIKEVYKCSFKNTPRHIHVSEQIDEVTDCLAYLKKRPIEWLLEDVGLSSMDHLVHATHSTSKELEGIISSGAQVVLCPSTEGNLGDGPFPITEYIKKGGHFSIGTDSHIGLSPMEELRWLDYGARLIERRRNPFCFKGGDDSGAFLIREAYHTGCKAMGNFETTPFCVGKKLKGLVIKDDSFLFKKREVSDILSTLVYSGGQDFFDVIN